MCRMALWHKTGVFPNFARHLDYWDFKFEIKQIHFEILNCYQLVQIRPDQSGSFDEKEAGFTCDENKANPNPFPNTANWLFPRWTCKIYPTDRWNIPSGVSAYSFSDSCLKAAVHEHDWFQFYGLDAIQTSYNLKIDWLFLIKLKVLQT